MILGFGIDALEIERFFHWHTYSAKALQKVFAESEIAYCLENNIKSAERFAVRFAAKEAFFKALCASFPQEQFKSLNVFKNVAIKKSTNGHPILQINWQNFWQASPQLLKTLQIHVSLTHTKSTATAIVILEKLKKDC